MHVEQQPEKRAPPDGATSETAPDAAAANSPPPQQPPEAPLVDHGAFAAWASLAEGDLQHHLRFHEAFLGHYDSLHDYVVLAVEQHQWDQQLDAVVPQHMRPYVDIDVDGLAQDLEASGELRIVDTGCGSIWVFDAGVQ